MSFPYNEFDVDSKVKNCGTPGCDGRVLWQLVDYGGKNSWTGNCVDCGAVYYGPSEEEDIKNEVMEDRI